MNVKKVLLMIVFGLVAVSSFGQRPQEDEHKYKKFMVFGIGYEQDRDSSLFTINAGTIKINWFAFRAGDPVKSKDAVTLVYGKNSTFATKCILARSGMVYEGNLDLVKEPSFYREGFSEQNGIVTYKKGKECLHLSLHFRSFKDMTHNELGRGFLVGKRIKIYSPREIGRNGRPIGPGTEKVISGTDGEKVMYIVYEYRFFQDGKEIKKQPNINRFGTWGTYGDDEKDSPPMEIVYKEASIKAKEGEPFMAGGLRLTFKHIADSNGRFRFTVEDDEGSVLSFCSVKEESFAKIGNPAVGQNYFPLTKEGFEAAPNDIKIIRAQGKTAKYLAVKPIAVNGSYLACQLAFWSDQAIQVLAQKPGQKNF